VPPGIRHSGLFLDNFPDLRRILAGLLRNPSNPRALPARGVTPLPTAHFPHRSSLRSLSAGYNASAQPRLRLAAFSPRKPLDPALTHSALPPPQIALDKLQRERAAELESAAPGVQSEQARRRPCLLDGTPQHGSQPDPTSRAPRLAHTDYQPRRMVPSQPYAARGGAALAERNGQNGHSNGELPHPQPRFRPNMSVPMGVRSPLSVQYGNVDNVDSLPDGDAARARRIRRHRGSGSGGGSGGSSWASSGGGLRSADVTRCASLNEESGRIPAGENSDHDASTLNAQAAAFVPTSGGPRPETAPRRFAPGAMQAPLFGGPMPHIIGGMGGMPMSPQLQHRMATCVPMPYGMAGGPPPQQMLGPACYARAPHGMISHGEMMSVHASPLNSPMASPMMSGASPMMSGHNGWHMHGRNGSGGPHASPHAGPHAGPHTGPHAGSHAGPHAGPHLVPVPVRTPPRRAPDHRLSCRRTLPTSFWRCRTPARADMGRRAP
jgi:hypothetical protein